MTQSSVPSRAIVIVTSKRLRKRKQRTTSCVSVTGGYAQGKKYFLVATRPRAMCQVRRRKYSVAAPHAIPLHHIRLEKARVNNIGSHLRCFISCTWISNSGYK